MMAGEACRLCDRLVISTAVTFVDENLVINIPEGAYQRGQRYCIVVAQAIPATATVNAPVYVTIGSGTTLYPLDRCNCAQATASMIRTRTRYSVCVVTTATGGSFRLIGRIGCAPGSTLASLPVAETAAAETGGGDA